MVILRRTRKLRSLLPELSVSPADRSDGALGDWYVNRVVIDRQPLLLMTSATSLLAVLTRARDVRQLPTRLPELVRDRLARLEVPEEVAASEVRTLQAVKIAPTTDRSVLGIMVDYAKMLPSFLPAGFSDVDLLAAEEWLWENPCHAGKRGGGFFPYRRTREVLEEIWGAA